jgi:putative flippase GtrA
MDFVRRSLDYSVVRFMISGGIAAFVEYIIFIICIIFLGLILSNVISFTAGLAISFMLNRRWVFDVNNNTIRRLLYYLVLSFINVAVGTGFIWILVNSVGVWQYVAKILVMAMIAMWNFVIYKRVIFKGNPSRKDE